ncbi:hypothetical protein PROFUN_13228 [Planoprotostelium fungivorum]|uniref:Uncharacterized protein n=1 Tax=Planoprotostelium fungivorum TaxID=1890364 RepID=A0A2P6N4R6_9EUKA|nr:hypothetical protein PROFUN_13228 [Planoprotostelium fungivorum]
MEASETPWAFEEDLFSGKDDKKKEKKDEKKYVPKMEIPLQLEMRTGDRKQTFQSKRTDELAQVNYLLSVQRFEEGLAKAEELLSSYSKKQSQATTDLHDTCSRIYMRMSSYEKALEHLDVLTSQLEEEAFFHNRSICLFELGNVSSSIRDIQRAIIINPFNFKTWSFLHTLLASDPTESAFSQLLRDYCLKRAVHLLHVLVNTCNPSYREAYRREEEKLSKASDSMSQLQQTELCQLLIDMQEKDERITKELMDVIQKEQGEEEEEARENPLSL